MDEVEREVDQEIVDLEDEIAETYNQGYFNTDKCLLLQRPLGVNPQTFQFEF